MFIKKIIFLSIFIILLVNSYSLEDAGMADIGSIFSEGSVGGANIAGMEPDGGSGVSIYIDLDKTTIISGKTLTGQITASSQFPLNTQMKITITNVCIESEQDCILTEYYSKESNLNLEMNGVYGEELEIPITLSKGEYYLNIEVLNVANPSNPLENSVISKQLFSVESQKVELDYKNSYIFSEFYKGFSKTPLIPENILVIGEVSIISEEVQELTLLIGICELDNKLCTSGYVSKVEKKISLDNSIQNIPYEIQTPTGKEAWNIRYILKDEKGVIYSTFISRIITVESLIDISKIRFNKGKAYVNLGETGYYSLTVSKKYEGSDFDLENLVLESRITDLNTNEIVTEQKSIIEKIDSNSEFEKEYTFVVNTPLYNYQICADIKDSKGVILSSKCYSKNNEEFSQSLIVGNYYRIDYDFECDDEDRIFDTQITVSAYDKTDKPISFQGLIMIKDLLKSSLVKREIITVPSTNYLISTGLRPERDYEVIFTDDINKQNTNFYISFPKNCGLVDEAVQKETTLILPGNIMSKEGENCSYLISKDKLKDVSSILCDDVETYVEENIENVIDTKEAPVIVDTEVFESQFAEKEEPLEEEKVEVNEPVKTKSNILRNLIILIILVGMIIYMVILLKKRFINPPNQTANNNQNKNQSDAQNYQNQQQYNSYQNTNQYADQQQYYQNTNPPINQNQNSNISQNNYQRRENE